MAVESYEQIPLPVVKELDLQVTTHLDNKWSKTHSVSSSTNLPSITRLNRNFFRNDQAPIMKSENYSQRNSKNYTNLKINC